MDLHCLTNIPFIPGAEATVLTEVPEFTEDFVGEIFIDDPWWGVVPLTREDYVEATYDAYTAALPPAWATIMFNSDCTAFKCGSGVWWGALWAYMYPVGSRVLVS